MWITSGKNKLILQLPYQFSFQRSFLDFDHVLQHFDWSLEGAEVVIDVTKCERANYQAMCLLVQYAWYLSTKMCSVTFKYGIASSGPTLMLSKMGATDWHQVLTINGKTFGNRPSRTFALRRRSDVQNTINTARKAIQSYQVGFPDYLSYIVSELLYNATEHGSRTAIVNNGHVTVPSIFSFGRYTNFGRLSFFVCDLGVGIKAHLEQAHVPFATHQDAIMEALRPNVSGTFGASKGQYEVSNNAGMGLTYSSMMSKRLKGDMFVVSHNGLTHISPEDVTSRSLKHSWPGTFVLVNLNIASAPSVSLEQLIAEIRGKASLELSAAAETSEREIYRVSIYNYFGKWAEDKDAAIKFRDRRLLPEISSGKKIELDFRDVETAPHSFLNALLGTAVKRLGIKAYQSVKVHNASGPIHEIIQTIFETNIPTIE